MNEQDELKKLRALLAEKEQQVQQNKQLLQQKDQQLKQKDQQIKQNNIVLDQKDQLIARQQIQIDNMIQALLQGKRKLFGASSEKTPMDSQTSLFETLEDLASQLLDDQKKITVKSHSKKPRQPGIRAEMLAGLNKEIEEYELPLEESCPKCGGDLKLIGKEVVRTEVEFIPAKLVVKQIIRQVGKCNSCGKKDSPNEGLVFLKAQVPKPILPHSISTPSLVAQVMYQKFGMGLPFNRQEKDWFRRGLVLPRGNMANWVNRCSEEWLSPIYKKIHEQLIISEVLHMDETRIQCNKETGKKASSDSYMWVMRSGASEEKQAAYFHYDRSRSTEVAQSLVGEYVGYLITDAYAAYNKAGHYKRALCWAHVRRYYIESIPLDSKGKEIKGSKGAEGRAYIDLLFKIEKEIKDLSFQERLAKRQEASQPILDVFWSWVEETSALHTTNEKLTKALTYSLNQRKYLETFMEDGRIPLSNNLCEANIKPFATARRAWLFADTPKGARANAVLYTLVESAKANELDIYEYLKYLLEEMPNNNHMIHPEILDQYMPWSEELPEKCRLKKTYKKSLKS
jgi:transposase